MELILPKEFPHGDASIFEQRTEQLSQIQPNVRDIYGHVIRHFQCVRQAGEHSTMHAVSVSQNVILRLWPL